MTSRLKLKKKKYHPPFDDSQNRPNIDDDKPKPSDSDKTNKTYAQIARVSSTTYNENEIFTKAIASAQKHNIKLKPGRKDRGYGNCVFEAVINNMNDRACFRENSDKLPTGTERFGWMK